MIANNNIYKEYDLNFRIHLFKLRIKNNSLIIFVKDDNKNYYKITFKEVVFYSVTDEGNLFALIDNVKNLHTSILISKNSDTISNFHKKSFNTNINLNILNYLLLTTTDVFDILCLSNPIIEKLYKNTYKIRTSLYKT